MIYQFGKDPALRFADADALSNRRDVRALDFAARGRGLALVQLEQFALAADVTSTPSSGNRVSIETLLFRCVFGSGLRSYVALDVNASFRIDTSATTGAIASAAGIRVCIDGLAQQQYGILHSTTSLSSQNVQLSYDLTELDAGYHVAEIKWSTNNGVDNTTGGGTAICNAASEPSVHGCSVTIAEYA